MIKAISTNDSIQHEVLQRMNEISEDHELKDRWISRWQLSKAAARQYDKIQKILKEG